MIFKDVVNELNNADAGEYYVNLSQNENCGIKGLLFICSYEKTGNDRYTIYYFVAHEQIEEELNQCISKQVDLECNFTDIKDVIKTYITANIAEWRPKLKKIIEHILEPKTMINEICAYYELNIAYYGVCGLFFYTDRTEVYKKWAQGFNLVHVYDKGISQQEIIRILEEEGKNVDDGKVNAQSGLDAD